MILSDYNEIHIEMIFTPLTSMCCGVVEVVNDNILELNETLLVQLVSMEPGITRLMPSSAIVTILEDTSDGKLCVCWTCHVYV